MINAMIIDEKDTVAVAIEEIQKGNDVTYKMKDDIVSIKALDDIQIYHKMAIADVNKGEPIIKYGEHIGLASEYIHIGNHVHTHNVENHRENLDQ